MTPKGGGRERKRDAGALYLGTPPTTQRRSVNKGMPAPSRGVWEGGRSPASLSLSLPLHLSSPPPSFISPLHSLPLPPSPHPHFLPPYPVHAVVQGNSPASSCRFQSNSCSSCTGPRQLGTLIHLRFCSERPDSAGRGVRSPPRQVTHSKGGPRDGVPWPSLQRV